MASLLDRFGLTHPPQPPFNASAGRLLHIAVGAEAGSSNALKEAVRESFEAHEAAPFATPAELVWLARYAVIARDFTTARNIAALIPNEPVIKEKVGPIVNLATLQPPVPEVLNPENYYTVVYDYASRNEVQNLLLETS